MGRMLLDKGINSGQINFLRVDGTSLKKINTTNNKVNNVKSDPDIKLFNRFIKYRKHKRRNIIVNDNEHTTSMFIVTLQTI